MFGYILPVKPEMKVKHFELYRGYYCGVCKQLQKSYGFASRFLLNYDLVLVGLLADALSGEQAEIGREGCFANPLMRRQMFHNTKGLALSAHGLIILSYHKLCDNLVDEKPAKRFLYRLAHPIFAHLYKKAASAMPAFAQAVAQQMQRQQELEQAGCNLPDEAADPTAKMCEALFAAAARTPAQQRALARLGLFAGQIVYLLDAAEDFEADEKNGSYNVFINMGYTKNQAVAAVQARCRMAAGEIALCYNLLPFLQYKEILDNIFYLGLPAGIQLAGKNRKGRIPKHGQINSV